MGHFVPRPGRGLRLLLGLLVSTLACQSFTPGGRVGSPAPPTAAEGAASPSFLQTTTPSVDGTAAPLAVEFGSGPFDLTDTAVGLAELSGYTASLRVTFEGTQAGQPSQWSTVITFRQSTTPPALEVSFQRPEAGAPRLYLAEIAGATYEQREGGACTAKLADPAEGLADQYHPARSLSPVVGADEAGTETVNGVAAIHYTFDERALGFAGFTELTGDLWVAADAGYLVRYRLTTQAGPEFFGQETDGSMTWEYEVTSVNEPVDLEAPADCPAGLIDVALPEDATNLRSLPGFLSYDTALAPPEAGALYRDALPGLGWTLANTSMVTDTAALLNFSQGDSNLTISVTANQAGSAVTIVQTR